MQNPLIVDLKQTTDIKGFYYTPSTNNQANHISKYNFYISNDGKEWELVKNNAVFNNIKNNPIKQDILLDKPIKTRYIKLEAIETTLGEAQYAVVGFGAKYARE